MKKSSIRSEVEQKQTISRISIKDYVLIINDFVCTDNDVVQFFEALEPRKLDDAIRNSLNISVSTFKRSLGECVTSTLPFGIVNEVLSNV